jgi:acyl dehydratase
LLMGCFCLAFARSAQHRSVRTSRISRSRCLANEARYKRPAIVGDTVTPEFTVMSVESKDAKRGILLLAIALYNQRRELILEGVHVVMIKRRTTAT